MVPAGTVVVVVVVEPVAPDPGLLVGAVDGTGAEVAGSVEGGRVVGAVLSELVVELASELVGAGGSVAGTLVVAVVAGAELGVVSVCARAGEARPRIVPISETSTNADAAIRPPEPGP